MTNPPNVLVISNMSDDPAAEIFTNDDNGHSWNVTRAAKDCAAGKHKVYKFEVAQAYAANDGIEVDDAKVGRYMRQPEILTKPAIVIIESGTAWLIDGHHRVRALHRMGVPEFLAYVIEEQDGKAYQVLFNGQRRAPFKGSALS